jgi:hypothetical protein
MSGEWRSRKGIHVRETPMPGTESKIVETQARRAMFVAVVTSFLGIVWPATLALQQPLQNLRHPAVIDSAYFAFAMWAGASVLMLQVARAQWKPGELSVRAIQWAWFLAWVLFAVHVGYAFRFAHGMSHANAMQHVETTSGFGPGIFVSYVFTLIWMIDALWLALHSLSYTRRPCWLGYALHGFLVFITFNGTVVYGHGFMRWVCLGVFACLAGQWIWSIRTARRVTAPQIL